MTGPRSTIPPEQLARESTNSDDSSAPVAESESIIGPRSRPGLALFLGGAGFLLYSVGLTHRALVRQRRLAVPQYYVWNNAPPPKTNGLPAAIEALVLSTLNVCCVGVTLAGGWMWALQVRNMEDLRWRLRSRIGGGARPGTKSKQEVEEEVEEWIAKILARKAEKDRQKRGAEREQPKD